MKHRTGSKDDLPKQVLAGTRRAIHPNPETSNITWTRLLRCRVIGGVRRISRLSQTNIGYATDSRRQSLSLAPCNTTPPPSLLPVTWRELIFYKFPSPTPVVSLGSPKTNPLIDTRWLFPSVTQFTALLTSTLFSAISTTYSFLFSPAFPFSFFILIS